MADNFVLLDLMRGIAALLVLASHARAFVLEDFTQTKKTLVSYLFYGLTSLGHEAVIVFFVLSGFLISRSVVGACAAGTWSWRDYAANRLARLWVVLLPCLFLTAALDWTAIKVTGSAFYDGALRFYHSGPVGGPIQLDPVTFLGNALFLQTLVVPVFGSNGPLWSLANEFWYYLLFPLIYVPLHRSRTLPYALAAITAALFAAGIAFDLQILSLWPAWLAGYIALAAREFLTPGTAKSSRMPTLIAAGLLLATLAGVLTRSLPQLATDLALSLVVSWLVVLTTANARPHRAISALAVILAKPSYSLYLSHFPLLALLSAIVLHNERTAFGWTSSAAVALYCVISFAWAYLIYALFERHTKSARRVASTLFGKLCFEKLAKRSSWQHRGSE